MGARKWMAALGVLSLLAAGCGGGQDDEAEATANVALPVSNATATAATAANAKPEAGRSLQQWSLESAKELRVTSIPAGGSRIEPLLADREHDRTIIARIVEWLNAARESEFVAGDAETTVPQRPPVQAELRFADDTSVIVEPVCTLSKQTGATDCHAEEGLVRLYRDRNRQPEVIVSPDLASWVNRDYRYDTVALLEGAEARAVGGSGQGELALVPKEAERVNQMGAPSCIGTESDYHMVGSYDLLFRKPDGSSQTVRTFDNLNMIQPDLNPIRMERLAFDSFEAFMFTPAYADCHETEFYLFGIRDGKAFPFTFRLEEEQLETFYTSASKSPRAIDGKLVIDGGIYAGMDYPIRYTFQPDLQSNAMVLVEREDIHPQ